jgi:type II secretory pathway pseudopilin PulG
MKRNTISMLLIVALIITMAVPSFASSRAVQSLEEFESEATVAERNAIFQDSVDMLTGIVGSDQIEELKAVYENIFSSRGEAEASFHDALISIQMQAAAHSFTDDQIRAMVAGFIESTEDAFTKDSMEWSDIPPVSAPSRMPDLLTENQSGIQPFNANNDISTRTNTATCGLGYEVRSRPGFRETTAFATVGRSNINIAQGAAAYMFHTVYYQLPSGLWRVNDYGIGFINGRWQIFVWGCWTNWGTATPRLAISAGQQLYFMLTIENQMVRMRILDANNFGRVFWDQAYTTWNEIPNNGNRVTFNRQITIADDRADNVRRNSGFFLREASFHSGHLYTTTSFAPYNANNTEPTRRGKFGSTWVPDSRVMTFSNTRWSAESISIHVTTGTPVWR